MPASGSCSFIQQPVYVHVVVTPEFFIIWSFFLKFLTNIPLAERIQKMDPSLGAIDAGASVSGAELLGTVDDLPGGSEPE